MRIFSLTRQRNSGFTLFELLIAISLVGLLTGLVVASVSNSVDRGMKQASNRLASTIRYLYDKSASEGVYIRLMLDLEENSYWVEATGDPYKISLADDSKKNERREKIKKTIGCDVHLCYHHPNVNALIPNSSSLSSIVTFLFYD